MKNQINIPNEKYIAVCVRTSVAETDNDTVLYLKAVEQLDQSNSSNSS